ncbi:SCO7613 C-terminal domain-containing membrane protein [Micromonospora sp. NPDC050397]|uniref:SCO7613 C-terminal domain-containing membrane protein n=1 Tax=Micromonospora sp. NPDC050397 TaxID=3364279 RepID=UPI00384FBA58
MTIPPNLRPCPVCGGGARLNTVCPGCGRAPDPVAAEIVRLDGEINALAGQAEQARQTYAMLVGSLDDLRRRRAELAARWRPAALVARPVIAPVAPVATTAPEPPVRPEASTRAVQNLLFVLGGLLLCAAAVVFMVVTWSVVGVAGRAAILAGITAAVLALPMLATRRGLTATAETFSVVGLLLVALDGYAAWSVDLFGVTAWSGTGYAALVCGVSALAAIGYQRLTRLWAPWFTMFALAQPVLPLLAAQFDPGAAGWALVYAALATFDLLVIHSVGVRPVVGDRGTDPGTTGPGERDRDTGSGERDRNAAPGGAGSSGAVEPEAPGLRVGGGGADGAAPGGVALARRVVGWVAYAAALAGAALSGLIALLLGDGAGAPVLAGGPLLVAAAVLVAGAVLARNTGFQAAAGLVVVLALAAATLRPVADLYGEWLLVATGLVVAVLSGVVALVRPRLPEGVRRGPWVGGLVLVVGLGSLTGAMTAMIALEAATRSQPLWRASGTGPVSNLDWQVPVTVLLVALALAVLLPRSAREPVGAVGVGLALLALPAALPLPWWGLATLELVVAVALLLAAVRVPATSVGIVLVRVAVAVVLVGHAFLLSLARPAGAATVLGVIVLVGLAVAGLAVDGPTDPDRVGAERVRAVRRRIGGVALTTGLLAVPGTTVLGLFAAGVVPWWQVRALPASAVLLLAALGLVRRHRRDHLPYADTALAGTVLVAGLAPLFGRTGEPLGVYSAVALLLAVTALWVGGRLDGRRSVVAPPAGRPGAPERRYATPGQLSPTLFCVPVLTFPVLLVVAPAVGAVLLGPYGWLTRIWSGGPDGVGITPGGWPVDGRAAATLVLFTLALALAGGGWHRSVRGALLVAFPSLVVAVPVVLAAAGARWPVVPAVALLGGLAALLVGTVGAGGSAATGPIRSGLVSVPVGLPLAGAGLAGGLPTKAGTLVALGLVVLAGAAIGAAGRRPVARVVGWLVCVGTGLAFALTAGRAAELPLRLAAFAVLGVAATALAGGALLRVRRPTESVAIEAAGHAGALVALLATVGAARYAAAVATIWGVVVGIRALRPNESVRARTRLASVAAGCELLAVWLLLTSAQVAVLEAYTLPAAACALVVGALALRLRPELSSWVTYGPGLAAALLPSLASVLVAGDEPWRRLLLGVGALVVVLAGAHWRQQAPVLLGGGTLAVVALYEVVGAWDRLPRWIFLAAGGVALISLAVTYERRRRDLARWRAAVGRMG